MLGGAQAYRRMRFSSLFFLGGLRDPSQGLRPVRQVSVLLNAMPSPRNDSLEE